MRMFILTLMAALLWATSAAATDDWSAAEENTVFTCADGSTCVRVSATSADLQLAVDKAALRGKQLLAAAADSPTVHAWVSSKRIAPAGSHYRVLALVKMQ